jgi:uncharacterized spore protein YtfJ
MRPKSAYRVARQATIETGNLNQAGNRQESTVSEHNGAGQGVINAITHTMESYTSRQVFGEPITNGNVMIIPVARVRGGGGGGGGSGIAPMKDKAPGDGAGAGMSLSAKPVGAFVVRGSDVSWRPAVDLNRIVLGGQIVAICGLLVLRGMAKRWPRKK